ncbi:hypothetical protein [Campylobacter coli]|uniref:hypothetical protein n=1 Tax=Campylobacter coli TaxID=195 RepID=UPI003CEA77D2
MKRIDIYYGGERYSVGQRTLADVQSDIEAAMTSGAPAWVQVNDGDGAPRTAYLLITPGVPIAVIPIPEGGGEDTGPIIDISDKLIPS